MSLPSPFKQVFQPSTHHRNHHSQPNRIYLPSKTHSTFSSGARPADLSPYELNEQITHHDDLNPGTNNHQQPAEPIVQIPTYYPQQYFQEILPPIPEPQTTSTINDYPPNVSIQQERDDNNFDFLSAPTPSVPPTQPTNPAPPPAIPSHQSGHANPIDQQQHDEPLLASPQPTNDADSVTTTSEVAIINPPQQSSAHESHPPQHESFDVRFGTDDASAIHQVPRDDDVDVMMETTTRRHIEGLPTQDEDNADEPGAIDDRINPNTLKSLVGK